MFRKRTDVAAELHLSETCTDLVTTIRIASSVDLPHVRRAYEVWGYHGGVAETDVVYVAERGGAVVGLVRRTSEHGFTMLRGMHVAPAYQRQGIGSRLLAAFTQDLAQTECFCVPYTHLVPFYGTAGFVPISEATAPLFLRHRLRQYRDRGLDVLVLQRAAAPLVNEEVS